MTAPRADATTGAEVTHRQQLAVLAALVILVAPAWLFPRPAGADVAWRDSALPQSAFAAIRTAGESGQVVPAVHQLRTPSPSLVASPRAAAGTLQPTVSVTGISSWYRWRPGEAAAGPALRAALGPGWRGARVTVCAGTACVVVVLSDFCGCYGTRLIDLDAAAFAALAPLTVGLVNVEVAW